MYLVFDIGGTFIKYAVMNSQGERIEKGKFPTPNGHQDTVSDFLRGVGAIYDMYKDKYPLEGIPLSVPGQVDVERGIVYGGGCLPYLDKINIVELLEHHMDSLKVAVENDAKCAALAESWIGNAKGLHSAYVMVFGTGAGGAFLTDGKVYRGQDMVAGEISFLLDAITMEDLPKIRPIEQLHTAEEFENFPHGFWNLGISILSMREKISRYKHMEMEAVTGELIYQLAEEGDRYAVDMLENTYLNIARQILNIYALLAPEIVLIGGGITAQPAYVEGIKRYVKKLSNISHIYRNLKVDVCKFGNDSNLIGALHNYKQLYEGGK